MQYQTGRTPTGLWRCVFDIQIFEIHCISLGKPYIFKIWVFFLDLENAPRRASLEPTFVTRPTRMASRQFWPLIFSMNSIDFWKSKTDLNFCALSCASRHNKNYGLAHNALGHAHLRLENP